MDRKRHTSPALKMALGVILVAACCSGCSKPMLYHFKHYHGPFEAIARSNKTYFHSSQTGKIIEKDPCMQYCEPSCFGYEPTCWSSWPSECQNNCPVPDEVIPPGMPYEGQVIMEGTVGSEAIGAPLPSHEPQPTPVIDIPESSVPTVDETRLPAIRVPSIPADIESAIPSPSDSTKKRVVIPVVEKPADPATRIAQAKPVITANAPKLDTPKVVPLPVEETLPVAEYTVPPGLPVGRDLAQESVTRKEEMQPIKVVPTKLPTLKVPKVTAVAIPRSPVKVDLDDSRNATSRRKPSTLVDKLKVRVNRDPVSSDYQAAIEAGGPLLDQTPAVQEHSNVKSDEMLRIVQDPVSITVPSRTSEMEKSVDRLSQPVLTPARSERLADKLKNAKRSPVTFSKRGTSKKTVSRDSKGTTESATMLKVSSSKSSVVRFAGSKAKGASKRLDASPIASTELRFSSDSE